MSPHNMLISSLDGKNHTAVNIPKNAKVVVNYDAGGLDLRATSLQDLIEFYVKGNN